MIIRVFYNQKAFNNCLLVRLSDENVSTNEKKANVTKLFSQDRNVVGYNIEMKYESDRNGLQRMDVPLLNFINGALSNTFQEILTHDFTDYIVIGKVISCRKHPDSDHLHICEVDIESEVIQIVCGAANVVVNAMVVVARVNAVLPNGTLIQAGKLRGIDSYGMLCSEYELGLIAEKKKGILLLDETYQIGDAFF